LAQQAGKPMTAVLAGARVRQSGARVAQAQRVIQFAVSQQPGIGGDRGAAKLQQPPPLESSRGELNLHPSLTHPQYHHAPTLIIRQYSSGFTEISKDKY
jgi:hypothetical protein